MDGKFLGKEERKKCPISGSYMSICPFNVYELFSEVLAIPVAAEFVLYANRIRHPETGK